LAAACFAALHSQIFSNDECLVREIHRVEFQVGTAAATFLEVRTSGAEVREVRRLELEELAARNWGRLELEELEASGTRFIVQGGAAQRREQCAP
jgi:hypothetical protein